MVVLVLCGNGVCMGDRWIDAWGASEGDGIRVWVGLEADDGTLIYRDGIMKMDVYEKTKLAYTYSEETNMSSYYNSNGSPTTWKSPRISYDEMNLTENSNSSITLHPMLTVQVTYTNSIGEVLKDSTII